MAMAAAERRAEPVRLDGGGPPLTSSSVSDAANGFAHVSNESSLLSGRSSSPNSGAKFSFAIPEYFTREEARASLISLSRKLVLNSSSPADCAQLVEILNNDDVRSDYTLNGVASDDLSAAAIAGVSALIDHGCSALASIADAVAALSCEALGADVSPFDLVDAGDGSKERDAVAVAADFRVFLNGSTLVVSSGAKNQPSESSVAEIPLLHGSFREISRSLRSKTRAELNSWFRASSAKCMSTAFLSLALCLSNLGESSARRTRLVVSSSISDAKLGPRLSEMMAAKCRLSDDLESSSQAAHKKRDYVLCSHKVYELLDVVRSIVSLEAATAFVSLEEQRENWSSTARTDKKKKELVLGKGTNAIMQFIKGRFLCPTTEYELDKFAHEFQSLLLNPKGSGFDDFLTKVKEIAESNESRPLKLPKGTREFSNEAIVLRERVFAIAVEVFKRHGGVALDTPVFELREVLMDKYGEDSKLIYDLADEGGELCSLRFDQTVPFARHVAMNGLTSCKKYQIGKVFRRDKPSKGRYREFYQCDFDIAGKFVKMGRDCEVLTILAELLDELGIGDYEVKLNHRKLLDGMLAICGVPQDKFRSICSSIDKLDKQSFEQVKKEMVERKGLSEETAEKIGSFVKHRGSPLELLSKLKEEGSMLLSNSESLVGLNELEMLFEAVRNTKFIKKLVLDLSLARGLDYYTGLIFEAVHKSGGTKNNLSIAAGGRYDNLIGSLGRGKEQVPAVGMCLGIERVFDIMDQNQEIRATEIQVLVIVLVEDLTLGYELVKELWDAKLNAEFMVDNKLSKHLKMAKGSKIPYMAIVGDYELSKGVVKLKDMNKPDLHEDVPRGTLVAELNKRLGISS